MLSENVNLDVQHLKGHLNWQMSQIIMMNIFVFIANGEENSIFPPDLSDKQHSHTAYLFCLVHTVSHNYKTPIFRFKCAKYWTKNNFI